jgi:hypothetical protein
MRKSALRKSAVALSTAGIMTIAFATPSWAGASASAVTKKSIYDVQASATRPNTPTLGTASSVEFSSSARTTPRNTKWK